MDLTDFRLPMEPLPQRVTEAVARGVHGGECFLPYARAADLALPGELPLEDGVARSADGTLCVAVRTELPRVTPAMIDWWFGWHLTHTERYRLWHPLAHIAARVKQDRTSTHGDRDRYVGNTSYVDEYIGPRLHRLAIAFFDPANCGLGDRSWGGRGAEAGTTVCARGSNRWFSVAGGHLIHRVAPVPGGVVMRSRFWLGDMDPAWPVVGPWLRPVLNHPATRRLVAPDAEGLYLLVHCSEEMNHLGRFLPRLYHRVHGD